MRRTGRIIRLYVKENILPLLLSSIWNKPYSLANFAWNHEQVSKTLNYAESQAVSGLVIKGLMDSGIKLDRPDVISLFEQRQSIWQRNNELDMAVANLCKAIKDTGIRIIVVKGQTLAQLYPEPKSRSCGDIDFMCHPDDWENALGFFRDSFQIKFKDTNSPKHIEFKYKGVQYEMHRTLITLSKPSHQHYWDTVIMNGIVSSDETVEICGVKVPILPPTINALYVFAHIFGHFISEGIGLRQFCDWAMVLKHYKDEIDVPKLDEYLKGIGLKKAFVGFGPILTDYLGLPEEYFPFEIPAKFHRRAGSLWNNIIKLGNFGKNKKYLKKSGPIHGLQHLWRIAGQAIRFGYYAPAESFMKIPRMFAWWREKLSRMSN